MAAPAEDFAKRLRWSLDHAGFARGRGRASALALRYGVSRETSRKWLNGMAMPELERMIELATDFGVSFDWLATGRMPTLPANRLAEAAADYDTAPLSGDEMKVLRSLRRLPPPKLHVILDLIDLLG